jgi:hypothetical protein
VCINLVRFQDRFIQYNCLAFVANFVKIDFKRTIVHTEPQSTIASRPPVPQQSSGIRIDANSENNGIVRIKSHIPEFMGISKRLGTLINMRWTGLDLVATTAKFE